MAGSGILFLAHVAWFISLTVKHYSGVLVVMFWISPLAAALITSYLAPRKKWLLGMSMVLVAAILAVVASSAHQWLGNPVDFGGKGGAVWLFLLAFFYSTILCGFGSLAGVALAKKISH